MAEIDIAVPTYNQAPWIDQFFESLVAQDYEDWQVVARDDASTDRTGDRLRYWQSCLGSRMVVMPDSGSRNLGMIGNYDAVLAATTSRWVMFADADDVWRPGKISLTARLMRKTEEALGPTVPLIISTDAEVVDSDLKEVAPSYWSWSRMNPSFSGVLRRMVVESPVLTSTMIVNRLCLILDCRSPGRRRVPTGGQGLWLALSAA
jgi:glycosyltransferase involved in cell wall biosynthesis